MNANPWVWLIVTMLTFALCAFLPGRIQDEGKRKWVSWFILIPVSLVIIFYVYPMGLEVFRGFAVGSK